MTGRKIPRQFRSPSIIESNENRLDRILLNPPTFPFRYDDRFTIILEEDRR